MKPSTENLVRMRCRSSRRAPRQLFACVSHTLGALSRRGDGRCCVLCSLPAAHTCRPSSTAVTGKARVALTKSEKLRFRKGCAHAVCGVSACWTLGRVPLKHFCTPHRADKPVQRHPLRSARRKHSSFPPQKSPQCAVQSCSLASRKLTNPLDWGGAGRAFRKARTRPATCRPSRNASACASRRRPRRARGSRRPGASRESCERLPGRRRSRNSRASKRTAVRRPSAWLSPRPTVRLIAQCPPLTGKNAAPPSLRSVGHGWRCEARALLTGLLCRAGPAAKQQHRRCRCPCRRRRHSHRHARGRRRREQGQPSRLGRC
jgi:hypothetical protein